MAQAARRVVRAMPQIAVVRLDDTPQQKKKKVAAYARVSTDKEEQDLAAAINDAVGNFW